MTTNIGTGCFFAIFLKKQPVPFCALLLRLLCSKSLAETVGKTHSDNILIRFWLDYTAGGTDPDHRGLSGPVSFIKYSRTKRPGPGTDFTKGRPARLGADSRIPNAGNVAGAPVVERIFAAPLDKDPPIFRERYSQGCSNLGVGTLPLLGAAVDLHGGGTIVGGRILQVPLPPAIAETSKRFQAAIAERNGPADSNLILYPHVNDIGFDRQVAGRLGLAVVVDQPAENAGFIFEGQGTRPFRLEQVKDNGAVYPVHGTLFGHDLLPGDRFLPMEISDGWPDKQLTNAAKPGRLRLAGQHCQGECNDRLAITAHEFPP
jgi:hypothetical protein